MLQDKEPISDSELNFRQLFAEMDHGFSLNELLLDGSGRPVDYITLEVNLAFEKILGAPKETVVGRKAGEILPPEELKKWAEIFGKVVLSGTPAHYEMHSDKNRKTFRGYAYRVRKTMFAVVFEDISGRKMMEEALWESEGRYRTIVENINDGLIVHDFKGTIRDVNEILCNRLGYSREELIGASLSKITDPETTRRIPERMGELLKKGSRVFEGAHVRKDGTTVPLEISAKVVSFENGGLVQSFERDITERKRTENELRASEARYRSLIENTKDIVFSLTPDGAITYISPQVKVFGYKPEEALSKSFLEFVHPDDRLRASDAFAKTVATDNNETPLTIRVTGRDGKIIWIEETGRLLRGPDNSITGYAGILRDITERKNAEEALRASEKKFSITFQRAPLLMSLSDPTTSVFVDVNQKFIDVSGYSREELVGKSSIELGWISPDDRTRLYEQLHEQGLIDGIEMYVTGKNGRRVPVLYFGDIVTIDGKPRLLSITQDIRAIKKAEEDHIKTEKLEALGALAGGIAHDFNNLMCGVFGYIEMAKDKLASKNMKKTDEYLDKALVVYERARGLTKKFVTFARGGAPVKKSGDLASLLRETVPFALTGSNVRCSFAFDDPLWPCDFDEDQIAQVANNIAINARQAMPGGGALEVSARNIGPEESAKLPTGAGRYVRLTFQDGGPGVPEELRSRIFDPFFTTKNTGSGIGLATAWSIVKRHNGHIDLESPAEGGAAFHVYLPAAAAQASRPAADQRPSPHAGSGRVLVLDDEEYMRDMSVAMLESLGYTVTAVASGEKAVALFAGSIKNKNPFIAAVLDLTVPGGMGGREAAAEILKLDPSARLIVSSGYSEDRVMAMPAGFGFCASIEKPFSKRGLAAVMEKALSAPPKSPEGGLVGI